MEAHSSEGGNKSRRKRMQQQEEDILDERIERDGCENPHETPPQRLSNRMAEGLMYYRLGYRRRRDRIKVPAFFYAQSVPRRIR